MAFETHFAQTEAELGACYALMHVLRPHLTGRDDFIAQLRRQAAESYRLLFASSDGRIVALAGFRVQENLTHGRHVYVDDLVVAAEARRQGCGERLLADVVREAQRCGCRKLLLDAALENHLGHRFYFRAGLLATALRFAMPIGVAAA